MRFPTMAPARRSAAAWGACVMVLAAGGGIAGAQGPDGSGARSALPASAPPVEELVARALANAPSVAAMRERLAAAEAAARASDALADPMLEFEVRDAGFPRWTLGEDPMSMIGATIRQPLLGGGRKAARRAAATSEIVIQSTRWRAVSSELAAAVRTEYARLYALDRERTILRDAAEMARLLAETALVRYASGSTDQAAVLRAQLEQTRLSERAEDVEAEREAAVVAINRLLNQAPETPIGEVAALPEIQPLPAASTKLSEMASGQAPAVSVMKADLDAAARRVELMKADLKPNWTIGGSFFWQGGTDRVVSVTVGVDWPWRKESRQLPLVAASERELAAARLDLEDTAAAMRAEAARLGVEIRRADGQIVRYREGLLPQSSAALEAARTSYFAGRGDFASVLDEFRRWTEIRVELARREALRFSARARLDALVDPAGQATVSVPTTSSKEPRS